MKPSRVMGQKSRLLQAAITCSIIFTVILVSVLIRAANSYFLPAATAKLQSAAVLRDEPVPVQLQAILHYATSKIVPQQSLAEISVTFEVLKAVAPCNFLVFGLGYDSLMWTSLNPRGNTLFLEEDPTWIRSVLAKTSSLNAHAVKYPTQLHDADRLLKLSRTQPDCEPDKAFLRGNNRCQLALSELPDEVYDREWDVVMIDAPRGYFPEAPGRMAAIFSAAVMALRRSGSGVTHVFLHDVNRRVEKLYAEQFLCMKYMVKGVQRLWHFQIPPAWNRSRDGAIPASFC